MRVVLGALHQSGVLAHTDSDPPGYLPARDLATLPVRVVLEAVRSAGEDRYLNPSALPVPEVVEQTVASDRAGPGCGARRHERRRARRRSAPDRCGHHTR